MNTIHLGVQPDPMPEIVPQPGSVVHPVRIIQLEPPPSLRFTSPQAQRAYQTMRDIGRPYLTVKEIAAELGKSLEATRRHVGELHERGCVTRLTSLTEESGTGPNFYMIVSAVAE